MKLRHSKLMELSRLNKQWQVQRLITSLLTRHRSGHLMRRMWRQNDFSLTTETAQHVEVVQTSGRLSRRLTIFNPRPRHGQSPQSFRRWQLRITSLSPRNSYYKQIVNLSKSQNVQSSSLSWKQWKNKISEKNRLRNHLNKRSWLIYS